MNKNIWVISDHEKKRILELHQKATKSHYITEQTNEPRTESIVVDLDAKWGDGKYILNPDQEKNLQQKLVQIADFVAKNAGSTVNIQIESSESQVTNYDREKYPIKKNKKDYDKSKKLEKGVLSTYRANAIIEYLKKYFQGLNMNNVEFPQPIIKIGTTPYTKPEDKKTNASKYESERYVRAIISLEKTYDCLVGLQLTIGYYKGKTTVEHGCDEAIFDVKMNGISIGEVNLNNSDKDTNPKTDYFKNVVKDFSSKGRYSDGQNWGTRYQTFTIEDAMAKQIMDTSKQDKMIISLKPLVGQGAKYEPFFRPGSGSHSEVPWVTIKNKSGEILYDNVPNVRMTRGSMEETVILVRDRCGNALPTSTKK